MALGKKYKAFISYSHQADQRIVRAIHNGILRIRRTWYQRPQLAIFRDEIALSATAALTSTLKQSICDSDYFLLIACPESAASRWVPLELDCWLEENARAADKLLIVLTSGEIFWNAEAGDFDWVRTNALPRSLTRIFREEPKYVDVRAFAHRGRLSLRDRNFLQAIAELAAPLYGVSKEALLADETRRLRRTVAGLCAASLLFLVVAILAVIFAYRADRSQKAEAQAKKLAQDNEQEAVRQRNLAVSNEKLAKTNEETAKKNENLAKLNEATALQRLYVSQMNLAYRAWEENNPALVYDLLASHLPTAAGKDLRSFDWYYLWHTATNDLAIIMERAAVTAIAVAEDGNTIAAATTAGNVRLYDRRGMLKRELPCFPDRRLFDHLAFAGPDALVGATGGGGIRRWNLKRPSDFHDWAPSGQTWIGPGRHTLSADGSTVAYLTQSGDLLVHTVASSEDGISRPLRPRIANVLVLALSPDGRRVAAGTGSGEVLLNETEASDHLITAGRQQGLVASLAFSPDGSLLASGGARGEVKIWDVKEGKERRTLNYPQMQDAIASLAFSAHARLLAAGTGDNYNTSKPGIAIVWEVDTNIAKTYRGHSAAVRAVAFVPGGEFLVSGSADKTVRLWDCATDQSRLILKKPSRGRMFAVAVSPDGTRVVTGGEGASTGSAGEVDLWDAVLRKHIRVLRGHTSDVDAVAFYPDGSILSGSRDGTVRLWHSDSGKTRAILKTEPRFDVHALAVDPARHRLAAGGGVVNSGGAIQIWDAGTLRSKAVIRGLSQPIWSMAFSPDGKWLAAGAGSENPTTQTTLELLALPSGRPSGAFRGFSSAVRSLAFSPSGDVLAVGWGDRDKPGNISVWNFNPPRLRGVLRGHQHMVMSIAFTPDEKALITSSGAGVTHYAGEIKIWDLSSMQERATLAQLPTPIWSVALSADGRTLAAVTGDQNLSVWQAATEDAVLKRARTLMRAFPDDAQRALEFTRACSALRRKACLSEARKSLLRMKTTGARATEIGEWLSILEAVGTSPAPVR